MQGGWTVEGGVVEVEVWVVVVAVEVEVGREVVYH